MDDVFTRLAGHVENTCVGSEVGQQKRSLSLGSDVYTELVHRLLKGGMWPAYFHLVNTCLEVLGEVPDVAQMDAMPIEDRMNRALDQLAKMMKVVLPGGLAEFAENYEPRLLEQKTTALLAQVDELKALTDEPL